MRNSQKLLSTILLSSLIANANATFCQSLKAGDAAPPIKVLKWLKGTPVTQFKKGQVYVVEFTASYCIPCRAAAPHLTKIEKDYAGKVKVIGIDVWENNHPDKTGNTYYLPRSTKFVEKMGNMMDYAVAVDDPVQSMGTSWMRASNNGNIPTVFIVDKNSKIAWIGHPDFLDSILHKVVIGSYNSGYKSNLMEMMSRYDAATGNEDFRTALVIIDSVINNYPDLPDSYLTKFYTLLRVNENEAYDFAKHLLQSEYSKQSNFCLYITSFIEQNPKLTDDKWANLSIEYCKRGIQLNVDSIMLYKYYMRLAYFQGDKLRSYDEAISSIQKAKDMLFAFGNEDQLINTWKRQAEDKISRYKKEMSEKTF